MLAYGVVIKIIPIFNEKQDVIIPLSVVNGNNFKNGLTVLLNRLYDITNFYDVLYNDYYFQNDYILNITGGFKGVIPFLTLFGQIYKVSLKYVFEETNILLSIPSFPISTDKELFKKYWSEMSKLENNIIPKSEFSNHFINDMSGCIDNSDGGQEIMLTEVGKMLWLKYKKGFYSIWCSESVLRTIENQEEVLNTLKEKFFDKEKRENKVEPKLSHKTVYDDGNNSIRIFFFEEEEKIYVYKTFGKGDYDDYDRYWRKTQFSEKIKSETLKNSNEFSIEIKS